MRKSLFFALAVAGMLSSCSSEDAISTDATVTQCKQRRSRSYSAGTHQFCNHPWCRYCRWSYRRGECMEEPDCKRVHAQSEYT